VLWYNLHGSYLVDIGHIEGLHTTVVFDVPDVDHTSGVAGDEAFESSWAVDTNEWRLMTFKLYDFLFPVRVPNEDLEVKTCTDKNLVTFRICNFSNCLFVSFKCFGSSFGLLFEMAWLFFFLFDHCSLFLLFVFISFLSHSSLLSLSGSTSL
jgi:hypothetical protein